jgi:8-amino-7-oxononanoate synthase
MSISNPAFRPVQDARWTDLQRLQTSSPMYDAVIEEVKGRRIRFGDHWLADFAS